MKLLFHRAVPASELSKLFAVDPGSDLKAITGRFISLSIRADEGTNAAYTLI